MRIQIFLMKRLTVSICITTILMVIFMPFSARGEECKAGQADALQKLLLEVERNEKLYANLKFTSNSTIVYENFPSLAEALKPIQSEIEFSLIAQGKKFRKQAQSKGRFMFIFPALPKDINNPGKSSYTATGTNESIDAFDGKTRRKFLKQDMSAEKKTIYKWASSKGEVSEEPPGLTNKASLHTFYVQESNRKVSLSSCLKGVESIAAFPVSSVYTKKVAKIRIADIRIVGTEKFQGLQCTKIVIETIDAEGAPFSRGELWLARDRNFIPIRTLYYHYKDSKTLPNRESIVDAWREVRPGVWYPVKSHTNRFSSLTLRQEGRQKISWRTKNDVKSVSLDPPISPEVFSKVEFPPGTAVYQVKDGKRSLIKKEENNQN
ncbi:hypothetical protein [uncultured Gimesia sp.]|uniref:hypothetical protein n=1 Tax=uncultured Gimesia sp. TaxID=1678688 RepID=UPI00262CB427|nr:hypothetical protein [uncultured Gimesia sp.]